MSLASLTPQYGEVWIIFDRDQVQNFDEIIFKAKERGINVGWTNPCIEEWFCAYFGVMPRYQDSVSCCNGFETIFKQATKQKYVKSDSSIYEKLNRFGDEETSIRIANQKLKEHERNGQTKPSLMCPCTTIHCLVKEIKDKVTKTN